ncbi:MAG: hypothetical protein IJW46_05180 [Clostridia bacterium]|nr:hypothetical protein [Clostridia bacterium]
MDVEISIKLLLKTLVKHLWWIIIITVLVAILVALYTTYFITPVYSATTTARIMISDMNSTAQGNLTTTINILSTYATSVLSDDTLKTASEMIDDPLYTPEYLREIVTVSFDQGSIILYITAFSTNAENAAIIANTIRDAAAYCNTDLAELTLINEAKAPLAPYSPSMIKNVLLATMVAFVLSYALFLVVDIYNDKITTEDDLAAVLDLPVIGAIPLLESLSVEKKTKSEGK